MLDSFNSFPCITCTFPSFKLNVHIYADLSSIGWVDWYLLQIVIVGFAVQIDEYISPVCGSFWPDLINTWQTEQRK